MNTKLVGIWLPVLWLDPFDNHKFISRSLSFSISPTLSIAFYIFCIPYLSFSFFLSNFLLLLSLSFLFLSSLSFSPFISHLFLLICISFYPLPLFLYLFLKPFYCFLHHLFIPSFSFHHLPPLSFAFYFYFYLFPLFLSLYPPPLYCCLCISLYISPFFIFLFHISLFLFVYITLFISFFIVHFVHSFSTWFYGFFSFSTYFHYFFIFSLFTFLVIKYRTTSE